MTDFDVAPVSAIEDLSGDYELDVSHTRIGFVARHAMVTSIRGAFTDFEGTAHIDAADPSRSSVKLALKVASVDTGNEQRDGHLRSADFFAIETYPEITFVSTAVERLDDEEFRVTGDLTVKDVTKPVTVELTFNGSAKDPFGNLRAGFEGKTTVNRKDWGLTWNAALETGGFLVSDKIKLEFDVSAVKLAQSA
ncbi:MAG TPA: YceI family protein [Mycobacteriales bacterium]|jgi:polyisoprenoid-binding protein YceI|nr:YceI family protein [Mycobacteriales bacterium]